MLLRHVGYGEKLAFFGGLDARILESGDRGLMKKGVSEFVAGMKERGGRLVHASDHSLSPDVDYRDFLYSLEIDRENMSYRVDGRWGPGPTRAHHSAPMKRLSSPSHQRSAPLPVARLEFLRHAG